jgi:hypothetical protein
MGFISNMKQYCVIWKIVDTNYNDWHSFIIVFTTKHILHTKRHALIKHAWMDKKWKCIHP